MIPRGINVISNNITTTHTESKSFFWNLTLLSGATKAVKIEENVSRKKYRNCTQPWINPDEITGAGNILMKPLLKGKLFIMFFL